MNKVDYNPLRHDCEKRGCFNRQHRPRLEKFADLLPGKVAFSDIDAEVELNGQWLRMEFKGLGVKCPVGQTINFERLSKKTPTVIFVIEANIEKMNIYNFGYWRSGRFYFPCGTGMDELRNAIKAWVRKPDAFEYSGTTKPFTEWDLPDPF